MPSRYRLIVFEITAIQVTPESVERAASWCGGLVAGPEIDPKDPNTTYVAINVPTLRGVVRASEGDYIYKENNYFDVMSKRAFESKYEKVPV